MSRKRFMYLVGILGTATLLACAFDPSRITGEQPGSGAGLDSLVVVDSTVFSPPSPSGLPTTRRRDLRDRALTR